MPIRTEHVNPELFYQFGGVKVFHTHMDGDAANPTQDYWFTVNEDDMDESYHFDIRDKAQMGDAAKWYNAQADISVPGGAQWLQKQAIRLAVVADAPLVNLSEIARGGDLPKCNGCQNKLTAWYPQAADIRVFDACLVCGSNRDVQRMLKFMRLVHWPDRDRIWLPEVEDVELDMLPNVEGAHLVIRETEKSTGAELGEYKWPVISRNHDGLTPEKLMDRFVDRWLTLRGQQGEK